MSVDYGEFVTANVSDGANAIPLPESFTSVPKSGDATTVLRVNVEGWQNNRMNLESIVLNEVRLSILLRICADCVQGCLISPIYSIRPRLSIHRGLSVGGMFRTIRQLM